MRDHRHIKHTSYARNLRKNSTDVERILWGSLRNKQMGVVFRRQHAFPPYIADFYCHTAQLVIELDGSQHGGPEDLKRTKYLESLGLKVLRFWNNDILENLDGVLMVIQTELLERTLLKNL